MKKNKKILAASLATSLVLGGVAGLPLSTKGLLENLGGVAHAADGISNKYVLAQLTAVYNNMTESEKAAIDKAREKLNSIDSSADAALVEPVWSKLHEKGANVTAAQLLDLIKDMAIVYDPTFSGLQKAITKPENRAVMAELARAAGYDSSKNDFTFDDAIAFSNAMEATLKAKFASSTELELVSYALDSAEAKKVLQAALKTVLGRSDLKVSALITKLGVSEVELMKTYELLNNRVDTVNNDAQKALMSGFVRSKSDVRVDEGYDWFVKTYSIRIFDSLSLPNSIVTWDIAGSDKDKIEIDGAKIKLKNNNDWPTTVTLTFSAKVKVDTKEFVLFENKEKKITFEKAADTPTGNTGGGGGGGGNSSDPKGPDQQKALEQITKNMDKIAELAKNPNAGNGLKKAQEAIQEAIAEAAKIDVSGSVKVDGDVAKAELDAKKLADIFKTVKDIAKAANDKLKEAAPGAKPAKVTATLDLGTVTAGTTQIPLSADILKAAQENGIDAIAVRVNGIVLAVDVDQLSGATTVTVKKEAQSVATSATQLKVASDVYEFNFESDGKKKENFSKPVEVKIPVPTVAAGVDTDLLVLAKIQDGQLIFKGGQYNAEKKEFAAQNKSFSTYAVVENKVSFKDTASVESWAGRQIAVVAAKGIVEGRDAGQFVPEGQVTRAEFAKLIVKTFGLEDAAATESFADVNDSDWFKPYVAAAVKAGLVEGRSDTSFAPNANITRAEMATLASRALIKIKEYKAPVNEDALKAFADAAAINSTLTSGVAFAAEQGIVVGEDGGKFNPNANSTRAQAAVVIYRLLNK